MANKPAKRRKGEGKEDIKELNFGEDFSKESGVTALLNAEVKVRQEGGCSTLKGRRARWRGHGAGDSVRARSAEACRLRTRALKPSQDQFQLLMRALCHPASAAIHLADVRPAVFVLVSQAILDAELEKNDGGLDDQSEMLQVP
jgi:hypothetical protein